MSSSDPLIITHHFRGQEWLTKIHEETIEPDLPIIDPHHHFSEHWGGYYGEDLLSDLSSGHDVKATVYIQCGWGYRETGPDPFKPVGETERVVEIAESCQKIRTSPVVAAGIVGYANLSLGRAVDEVLKQHITSGKSRFRGIRCSGARHEAFRHGVLPTPPAHLFLDKQFREGFACLAPNDLSFESWTYHHQLNDVLDLARSFPETSIIVNHIGGTLGVGPYENKSADVLKEWKPLIKALSTCPNVSMKLGGLGTAVFGYRFFDRDTPPTSQELAKAWGPYFETCIESFGTSRCMFESNFPVDRAASSYHVLWNAFKRIAANASKEEKLALFHDNAARIYRLAVN